MKKLLIALPAALLLLGAAAEEASGQQPSTQQPRGSADTARAAAQAQGPTAPLLDAPVSRTEYLLGPGDVLDVAVFGDVSFLRTLTVTPEGTLVIPNIGVARIAGANLNQAQDRVRDLVYRYYRNIEVTLTLSQVRVFKVFVVGDVPAPGVRQASAATRVSEVVAGAGKFGIVRRNILLRRASGDSIRVDLLRFMQTGDLSANPTLREGDAVVVPAVDQRVEVYGRVGAPGIYEYRRGESLAELLGIVYGAGGFPANAADTVRLTRFVTAEQREYHTFSRAEAMGARGRAFALQPFDAVYVAELSNYKEQKTATIQGQVLRPGVYPIRPDTTTVRELVAMAGGFTAEASLTTATLRRPSRDTTQTTRVRAILAEEEVRRDELEGVPAELLRQEERQIAQIRAQGDETNVVVDFVSLFSGGVSAYDQALRSGDILSVPRRTSGVIVLGAVGQPGIVGHSPGRGVGYYVNLAGGYSRRADRNDAVVLKAKLGTRVDAGEVSALEPGDQIVVPFRHRRTFLETVQTTQGVVATVTGFVLTTIALWDLVY
ncbi:MAG TPA: SLBB domain-containing protein [Longimicrobiaceae bacterium]|nr:SLBB domain-containing protein [Longimicrobiaceae bacterium]